MSTSSKAVDVEIDYQRDRCKLYRKLLRLMKAIPELEKTGSMSEEGKESYKYHEADSIRVRFRTELLRLRLLCLPTSVDEVTWRNATHSGGNFNYSSQRITFTFIDTDTGELLQCQAVGWGGDALDKAAPKAAIQALKYFLVNGFFVEGIELDGDSPEEQLAAREANRPHQWFQGVIEAANFETEHHGWIMIEGNRLWPANKRIAASLKKAYSQDHGLIPVRVRTYMGELYPNSKNPHALIDKIEPLKIAEPQEVSQ